MKQWMAALLGLMLSASALADAGLQFKATGVNNEIIDLETLRGRWVVVNFWATWCKPCRKEIPDLSELHLARDDIEVIGLAFEEAEVSAILAFLEQYPARYPIAIVDVYDPPEVFGTPMVLPTTVMISPEGHNTKTFVGPITRAMIEEWVDAQEDSG